MLWLKAFHIMSLIAWMAALLYLEWQGPILL